ncbi:two-component system sensor kinase [Escherichia coli]|nr:two-component system sensor kinase [Escherichia coli]
MAPVIKRSERRILWASAILLGIALVIGAGMVWWINRSIARLTRYADSVTDNKPVPLPELGSSELRKLAQALESMRVKLEGKNYIEQYVYALTHELKSPLAAIRGAAEILRRRSATGSGGSFYRQHSDAKCANAGTGGNVTTPGKTGEIVRKSF